MEEIPSGDLTEAQKRLFDELIAARSAYIYARHKWNVILNALGFDLTERELYEHAKTTSVCKPPMFDVPEELARRAGLYLVAVENLVEAATIVEKEFELSQTREEIEKLTASEGSAEGVTEIMDDIRSAGDALKERDEQVDEPPGE